jgi:hypothetical protein
MMTQRHTTPGHNALFNLCQAVNLRALDLGAALEAIVVPLEEVGAYGFARIVALLAQEAKGLANDVEDIPWTKGGDDA